jgi:hypothetical protein
MFVFVFVRVCSLSSFGLHNGKEDKMVEIIPSNQTKSVHATGVRIR